MSALSSYQDLTTDEIAEALRHCDSGCDRDTWFQMACAVKSELGEAGFSVWDNWSKTSDKYNFKDARDTWKSAKAGGKITIGTLIGEAKRCGWNRDPNKSEPLTQQQVDERIAKRKAEEAEAEEKRTRARADAAARARDIWLAASDVGGDDHAYLKRKGVQAYGLKVGKWHTGAEALIIPIRNIDGHLMSLQAIFTNDAPELGRDRDFLPGGQKRGGFHMIGGKPSGSMPKIIACEGYATGATIHQATGWYVAVAFDAGNLASVARDLRQAYGAATIIIAADDDKFTKGNPGISSARQAASAASAILVSPTFANLETKPTDFNDLHQLEGIEAVRTQLQAAIPSADNDNHLDLSSNVGPFEFPHLSEKMQPLNTHENLKWMLDQYGIGVRYNVISKDVIIDVPGQHYGDDSAAACALAEINSLCARNRMPKADTPDYLKYIANKNQFNPVAEFITSRPWDGYSRLSALYDTLQTERGFNRGLLELLVRRWLISAVAAALTPSGFWSKGVLVLQGEQSLGKSAWIKSLLPYDRQELVKEGASIDPSNKDTISSAISHWIVELGELDGTFRKADMAKLKAFVSSKVDMLRKPYDRLESRYQRRTVFFASVNPRNFLSDDTGNVRWWTIPVIGVDYLHKIDVQQLWAEVATLFRAGEHWWLERHEEASLELLNREHEAVDPIEELILKRYPWGEVGSVACKPMNATDVLIDIGMPNKLDRKHTTEVAKILRKLTGGEPNKVRNGKFYDVPQHGGPL